MTILDVKKPELGVTVVDHPENFPGRGDMRYLSKSEDVEENLYEQRDGTNHFHSRFVDNGYCHLIPVCDIEVIRARQNTIRSFLNDFPENQRIFPILNMMHLIEEWAGQDWREGYTNEGFYSKKAGKVLQRYLDESYKLLDEFDKVGGTLRKVAESYRKEIPREEVEMLVRVCEKGRFDSLILENLAESVRVTGVIGRRTPKGKDIRKLGECDLQKEIGWNAYEFVKYGFFQGINMLDRLFSPLGFLYLEANYMHRRRQQGKRVCLSKINNQGVFEMIEGEPILYAPEPVEWRSFRFDEKNSRSILNGLHSGGKTHLLCDIPLYILRGLRGLPVPAESARIPLTRRIFYSLHLDKQRVGGSLESEMQTRVKEILHAKKGDLFLIDEFLQHASPDAADPLEPIILDDYAKTRASFVIVDHRGESIEDGSSWRFWSPGFRQEKGKVMPTYKFERGKPSQEVLMKHARQLLAKLKKELDNPTLPEKEEKGYHGYRTQGEHKYLWLQRAESRILNGEY